MCCDFVVEPKIGVDDWELVCRREQTENEAVNETDLQLDYKAATHLGGVTLARVGMVRHFLRHSNARRGAPHTRGDGPVWVNVADATRCAPHALGRLTKWDSFAAMRLVN